MGHTRDTSLLEYKFMDMQSLGKYKLCYSNLIKVNRSKDKMKLFMLYKNVGFINLNEN